MSSVYRPEDQDLTLGSDDQASRESLRELILYIAHKCQSHQKFGAVKLAKILFYSDFISFAKYGKSITGTQYKKLPLGPVPTAAKAVEASMVAENEIVVKHEGLPPYVQRRIIALREANLDDYFKPHDIALVDQIIEELSDLNASEVSRRSHDLAWQVAGDYEVIPYEAVFIYDRELDEHEITKAHELASKYGW